MTNSIPVPSINLCLRRPLRAGVGYVSQWFGANPALYEAYNLAGHEGLDYACAEGSDVLAMHDGNVRYQNFGNYGLHAILQGTGAWAGVTTYYCHLSAIAEPGSIKAGDMLGKSGNTGRSTGPHLHIGLRVASVSFPAYRDFINPYLGRLLNGDA